MELTNADKFRLALEAVNRHDIEGALEHVDPDVEWRTPGNLPDSETYYGHDGVRKWWSMMDEAFEDLRIDPIGEFRELDGRHTLVPVRASGRGRESGIPVELPFLMLGTGDAQLSRMEFFLTEEEALEAAEHNM